MKGVLSRTIALIKACFPGGDAPRCFFLAPEVLQSSSMDCGPAALQSVLSGYDISSDYDDLRSRCQTDVDGTSVYDLARLGREMGVASAQVLVPRDTLLRRSARCTPAIAVTSEGAGFMHFVVLWNTWGPWVQVMDPGTGRRWEHRARLLARLPDVPVAVSEERFARWRKTSYASEPLTERLLELGLTADSAKSLVEEACQAVSWKPYATLDAATRMVATLVEGKAVTRREAPRLLTGALQRASSDGVPVSFWWIWAGEKTGMLTARGAPIVRFTGLTQPELKNQTPAAPALGSAGPVQATNPSINSQVSEGSSHSTKRLGQSLLRSFLSHDRRSDLYLLVGSVLLAALVMALDMVLLQALLHSVEQLFLPYYRAGAALVMIVLSLGGLLLDYGVVRSARNLGRRIELRMRAALFQALPQLSEEYLRTRPTSDMAERGHSLHLLRRVPEVVRLLCESIATLAASALGLVWIFPQSWWLSLCGAGAMVALPWVLGRQAREKLARARTQGINLERFYLDALTGVVPIRVHGAEGSVRREHEGLLVDWLRAMLSLHGHETRIQAGQAFAGAILSVVLVIWYFKTSAAPLGALLVFHWSSRLPAAGTEYVNGLLTYRSLRLAALRFWSPVRATQTAVHALADGDAQPGAADPTPVNEPKAARGVEISFAGVEVKAANRCVLSNIDLHIRAGQHVAIVGPSGAGKSSLVGLLLGALRPLRGEVRIDQKPLDPGTLRELRRSCAWIDPAVQIWNDTLLANVLYGADAPAMSQLSSVIPTCELTEVLENLPEGLQTSLGEAGTRLSGGQGQRVRLGRALVRNQARLAILDEPFRGLERERRQQLLARLRLHFEGATMLFVSHDIRDTEQFERVLVVEDGRVVEDGSPQELRARASRYRALLEGDLGAQEHIWGDAAWQRLRMSDGKLAEAS